MYNRGMVAMANNRVEVIERVRRLEPQLREYGVQRLALFGSFVRSVPHDRSDVDLLVDFEAGEKTFDNFLAVSELLEASLGRRVDLLTRESLSPYIGPRILAEAEDVVTAN